MPVKRRHYTDEDIDEAEKEADERIQMDFPNGINHLFDPDFDGVLPVGWERMNIKKVNFVYVYSKEEVVDLIIELGSTNLLKQDLLNILSEREEKTVKKDE